MKISISILALFLVLPVHVFSERKEKSVELILPDSDKTDPGWGNTDNLKNLEILRRIDGKDSQKNLDEASEAYRKAIENFQATESEIEQKREDYSMETHPADRYEWQIQARKDARERELAKMLWDGRGVSIQYLIRGMTLLEKIENPRILESPAFKDLRAGFYREYIKHQYAMKNYIVAMDMANRYILLDDKYYKEAEPHKILAVCFEKLEESASKNKKFDEKMEFKEKKKRHLITYAELQYGKDSGEYRAMMEKIMKDY